MLSAFIAISVFLFFACIALSIILYIVIQRASVLIKDHEMLQENFDALQESKDKTVKEWEDIYTESVLVVTRNLYDHLSKMKMADVSLIGDSSVTELYKRILATHEGIYKIMNKFNVMKGGQELPPYLDDAKARVEKQYINVKQKTKGEQFRHVTAPGNIIGVAPTAG